MLDGIGLNSAGGVGNSATVGGEPAACGALIVGSAIELPGEADDSAGRDARLDGCDCCCVLAAGEPIVGMDDVVVAAEPGAAPRLGSTRLLS